MDEYYNHHYIRADATGRVTEGWSDGPHNSRVPTEYDICINDKGGYQFRLVIDGQATEENPPLFDRTSGIPLYKWTGSEVARRTEAEIEADREAARAAAEAAARERVANAPETILLEMTADHEERLCILELFGEGGEI